VLTPRVYASIAEVDPLRWDAVGSDPLSSHAVLQATEAAHLAGIRQWCVVLEDRHGDAVAAAPLARIDVDAARLTHGVFHRFIDAVRSLRPRFLHTALLVCGTPLSVGNPPVRIRPGADRAAVYRTLAGLLDEIGDAERAPWRVFKELGAAELAEAGPALGRGARSWILAASEPNNAVAVSWPTFEKYLAGLRSHYRYKLRGALRKLEAGGVSVRVAPLGAAYGLEHHRLYEAVFARAAVQFEHLTPGFFLALGRAFGEDAPLIEFVRDGTVVGWVAMLFAGGVAYDLFHGIDYACNEELALYFNQLAAVIRLATERGAKRISLGQSTDVAKARFGAVAVPLWIGLAHRSRAVTAAMRSARRVLFPSHGAVRRRVFR
jgi:predicted N-acyltransferase